MNESNQDRSHSRGGSRLPIVMVLLGTLLVYAQCLSFDFVDWDDPINVASNPLLTPPSWPKVLYFWRQPFAGLYIPLSYTFFSLEAWIDVHLPGGDPSHLRPGVFHAGNLLLHLACVWLVYRIFGRFGIENRAAAIGAGLFALHPLHVESVAWITETKGLLSAALSLTAVWQYLAWREAFAKQDATDPNAASSASEGKQQLAKPAWLHGTVATASFTLAMLAKPSAVSVPLIVACLEWFWFRAAWQSWWLRVTAWCVIASAAVLLARRVQPAESAAQASSYMNRAMVAADALGFYVVKLIAPIGLAPDYGRTPERVLRGGFLYPIVGLLTLGLVGSIVLLQRRGIVSRPLPIATGVALLIVVLLPVLGLVPFAFQSFSTVADRYAYLALLGPALIAAWCVARYDSRVVRGAAVAILLVSAWASWRQASFWQDSAALFQRTLAVNPQSWMAHLGLGNQFVKAGDLDRAAQQYRAALAIDEQNAEAHFALAMLDARRDDRPAAIERLQTVLVLDPDYTKARLELAHMLLRGEKPDAAIEHYAIVLKQPLYAARAHQGMANALAMLGQHERAAAHYDVALAALPGDAQGHNNYANVLVELGRWQEAIDHYRAALAIDPQLAAAHRNVGLLLAARDELDEARPHLEFSASIHSDDPDVQYHLARSLAAGGDLPTAIEHLEHALDLRSDWTEAKQLLDRLRGEAQSTKP